MNDTTNDKDLWRPFGEAQWREFAEATQASDLQLKFAVARFNGATATKAASLAGYGGDKDAIRRAGYTALRSAAVVALLDMAAVHSPGENKLTEAEVDSRLARLVRSGDPLVMLKATELFDKRKVRAKEAGETPEDDGLVWWRICRDWLLQPNGASIFMLHYKAAQKGMGHPANYPLLADVHNLSKNEVFGPQIWAWASQNLSSEMRRLLDERLSDPKWQLETRTKIWGEIGVDISLVTKAA